jgi:alpha-galactosidase
MPKRLFPPGALLALALGCCVVLGVLLFAPAAVTPALALNNGLALTPPMGWNSWNTFGCTVSDSLIRSMATAMVKSGMKKAGYQYINIDDCWQSRRRAADGTIIPGPNFPNMKALADYVHSKGLKLGLYSDRGTLTCQKRMGSYGYESQDARTYAAWGVDYLKYDNCNAAPGSNQQADYERMRDALANSGRGIVFSLCTQQFDAWEPSTGNLWRTSGDIYDRWYFMLWNYVVNVRLAKYAQPGAWNDPDTLEVGNGGMTDIEYQTQFSLWAIMAAPLLASNDLRMMSQSTLDLLTNPEIIAVDQDPLGHQGIRVQHNGELEWISKELSGTNVRAVALLNRGNEPASMKVSWGELGLPAGNARVRDLWARRDIGIRKGSYTASVPSHGTVMLKIVGGIPSTPTPSPTVAPVLADRIYLPFLMK